MPSVPTAVLLLVLSAASWQASHQQLPDQPVHSVQPPAHTDLSPTAVPFNDSLTTTAFELLSSTLFTLLSLSSSLLDSLPSAIESLQGQVSSLSPLSPINPLLSSSSSASSVPHDRTIPVLLFLLVSLSVVLLLLTCLTVSAWQRYGASIAEFRVDWHNTRAQHRAKRAEKREKDGADGRQSSSRSGDQPSAAAGVAADSTSSSHVSGRGGRVNNHLYGFIGRARAISDAEEEMELITPTIAPGRDPFSQLKRRY